MRTQLSLIAVMAFGFQAISGLAATDPSKISGYEGNYHGTLILSVGGSSAAGTATGRFKASPSKERGSLVLASQVTSGSTTIFFTEQFRFNKKSLVYTFSQANGGFSATGSGPGRASIKKRAIRFSATPNVSGTPFTVVGTIRRTKRGLTAQNFIVAGGTAVTFTYNLKGHK